MTQNWDPAAYGEHGAFVHGLAGGVLEWLDAKPEEYILDLGCGDGQLTQKIANSGASVIGVDASAEMVEAARARGIVANVSRRKSCLTARADSTRFSPTRHCTGFRVKTR